MRTQAALTLSVAIAIAGCSQRNAATQESVDLMVVNGKVLTIDKEFSIHSTLVVKDGKVLAVGDRELARRYKPAREIDAAGRVVMPGFNDNHLHLMPVSRRSIDCSKARSIAEIQEMLRAKAEELGPGEWISGSGWDEASLAEKRNITRADIDVAAPRNPVVLVRAGQHSAVGNSLALKAAKIDRGSPQPMRGVVEKDAKGDPNGIIRERTDLYTSLVPPDTFEDVRAREITDLREYLSLGLTSVTIAATSIADEVDEKRRPEQFKVPLTFKQLQNIYAEVGDSLPRVTVQISYPGKEALAQYPHKTGYGDDRLKLGAIGELPFVDGGFTGPTAWTSHDYRGQKGFRGQPFFENDSELQELADDVARNGWQLGLHTIGDAAIDQAVRVYAKALEKYPRPDHRWYLAHYTMLPSKATRELQAKAGILAAAQPNFLYTLESRYVQTLEGDALEHVNPVGVPLGEGVYVSFGSDDLPIDPRVGLYAAVTRKGVSGTRVYGPEEAVKIEDALRMYTLNTAYMNFDEKKKGSLEAGKLADFIILDSDPLTIPPEKLLTMQIDMTVVGGRPVYERQR